MPTSRSEQNESSSLLPASIDAERAVLGGILLDNRAYNDAAERLRFEHFSLDSHRRIYARMVDLAESSRPIDMITLIEELDRHKDLQPVGDVAYVSSLVEGVPERPSIAHYVDIILEKALRRILVSQATVLQSAASSEELSTLEEKIKGLSESVRGYGSRHDWRTLFHTREEIESAPPLNFAIDGFLQEDGITLIGGLAGHGKTLCMLAMARALLEGGDLFTKFSATRPADRVLYLIPEAAIRPFSARLRTFHLTQYIGDRLFLQTLSSKQPLSLTDPKLLKAAEGADVFLDTAIRFMQGDENNASEQRAFAESLFKLQSAGARTITGAHHSPKNFGKENFMTLENVLRGSGDIGAMLCTAWGLKQIDPVTNSIYIANVKPRDFQPCEPFIIKGRPSLDETGYFDMTHPPGFAGTLSEHTSGAGRPELPEKGEKIAEARRLKSQGMSFRDIAQELNVKVGTLHGWLNPKQ